MPSFYLAAVAAVVAIAAAVVAAAQPTVTVAAAAEQNQQDDDPAHIAATKTVVTHKKYLQEVLRLSPLIPRYSAAEKMCDKGKGDPTSNGGAVWKITFTTEGRYGKSPRQRSPPEGKMEITFSVSSAANPCRLRSGKRCRRPHSRQRH